MQVKIGYALRTIYKLVIIILLLGLGVNYGLLTPRGVRGLDYSGIFGDSSNVIVVITLLLYMGQRLVLHVLNSGKLIDVCKDSVYAVSLSQKSRFSILRLVVTETISALIMVAPIIIGIYWSKVNFQVTDSLFMISRFFSRICIFVSCGIIYFEVTYPRQMETGQG